jgi:hypothetical protein
MRDAWDCRHGLQGRLDPENVNHITFFGTFGKGLSKHDTTRIRVRDSKPGPFALWS